MTTSETQGHSKALPVSGIRDNHHRGSVGSFLQGKIQPGSRLSIVSAYFTIYAFEALKNQLTAVEDLQFLFGEPRFVRSLDPDKTDKKSFQIEDDGLHLRNRLEQKRVARECADWIQAKVQIRSVKQTNLLHGKMYHIATNGVEDAIMGSSNFTVRGLGLSESGNNIELNLEVDSNRDRRDLKAWFDELWQDESLVEDVRDQVLQYLEQLYQNHAPQFIYYKTLFHIFERFLADQDASGLLAEKSQLVDTVIWNALFRYSFAQPKQILEVYRLLCADRTTPYEELCNLFDQETRNGTDMLLYNERLETAISSIAHTFKRRSLSQLQTSRGAVLVNQQQQATETSEFDLITWLVIKSQGEG
jgi:hypothetical protein